jgi:hypothetical protein
MAQTERTRGACAYCGREMTRGGMARHLAGCERRRSATAAADAQADEPRTLVHLQVRDAGTGDYWLHLEVDGGATLKQVDKYLRAIWLECCGHLSQFSNGGWRGGTIGMERKVGQVFRSGVELTHIYDFGTESVTLLKSVDVRQGARTSKHPIALMARNAAPVIACQECGAPATRLCMECVYDHERAGTLCDEHAAGHPHEEYGEPMALVNSPRMGMCGYEGPADPPY